VDASSRSVFIAGLILDKKKHTWHNLFTPPATFRLLMACSASEAFWFWRRPPASIRISEETMKKSTLFISAALTAFVLAVLAGVVTAFKSASLAGQAAAAAPAALEVPATAAIELPSAVPTAVPTQVGPLEAASLAAQFLNRQDVYSVESTTLDGVNAFKVTFSSGDIVYVGLDGQVISTTKLQPAVITNVEPTPKPHKKNNNNNNNGGGGGGEHEGEHEGEHD
jgi:hypothetical protein